MRVTWYLSLIRLIRSWSISCLDCVSTGRRGRLLYARTRDPAAQNEKAESSGRQRSGLHELPLRCVMIKVLNTSSHSLMQYILYLIYIIYIHKTCFVSLVDWRVLAEVHSWFVRQTGPERNDIIRKWLLRKASRGARVTNILNGPAVLLRSPGSRFRPSTSAW